MNGILADANCEGHLTQILRLFRQGWRGEVWESISVPRVTFFELQLASDSSDRELWQACHRHDVLLLTANRNDEGPDSLEATIRDENTTGSLPVLTLADDQRVLRDHQYAERVADRLLEVLFDIDSFRGAGRLYVP